jgi:hypothetical protein
MMILCLLSGPVVVLADSGSSGPDTALAPSGEWTPLSKGQEHWYVFEYLGHEEMREVEGEEDEMEAVWINSSIRVLLDSEPDDSIAFSIWTPENIRTWALGEEVEPVGRGGKDDKAPGDLCWCGTFQKPGTYYVVVEHTGQGPETAAYTLDIGGRDVLLTAPVAAVDGAAEPEAEAADIAVVEPEAEGASPGTALAASGEWTPISGGDVYWYTFDYRGHHEFSEDEDGDEVATWIPTPVEISLDAEPDNVAVFGLWNEEQVRLWALGEDAEPEGRGSENENEAGDLYWYGSPGNPGQYYVMVEHKGTEPGSFTLSITGEDILP